MYEYWYQLYSSHWCNYSLMNHLEHFPHQRRPCVIPENASSSLHHGLHTHLPIVQCLPSLNYNNSFLIFLVSRCILFYDPRDQRFFSIVFSQTRSFKNILVKIKHSVNRSIKWSSSSVLKQERLCWPFIMTWSAPPKKEETLLAF